MKKYISIKEARKEIADRSDNWYKERINNGIIKSISVGKGSKHLMETKSLLSYLDSIANGTKS